MSLAMYAAPFDNNDSDQINNKDNNSGRKRVTNTNNKTQKRYPTLPGSNSEKVLSVIQSMHNLPASSDDMADFSPLPPPTSVGVQSTILRDQGNALKNKINNNSNNSNNQNNKQLQSNTQSNNLHSNVSSNLHSNIYSNLDESGDDEGYENMFHPLATPNYSQSNDEYYKKHIPNYEEMYKNSGIQKPTTNMYSSQNGNDILIEKLNYMIHLLEENQDERTANVTEEVILYSFLGIFIIFIVDSFTRVGKYTR